MQAKAQVRAAADTAVVSARGLSKSFAEGSVVALDDASFDIRAGSFVSLVGPSGCGKSTILRLISGLIGKTDGKLTVHGDTVAGPRTDVGLMFQKATLLEWRTVLENVLLPTELSGSIGDEDREKAIELLHMVGLQDFLFSYPTQLSGGMQQRVALARLLQTGADILLLDEPFGALDEFTRERLNVELMRIVGEVGATALFVTHNIAEAIFLADQVFVMTPRPGRIADIVDVPMERPRPLSIQTSNEFNQLAAHVRDTLGADH